MCGITGKLLFDSGLVKNEEILLMNDAIKHRGPDDGGVYISKNKKVGLGHRRLSIIDLSPLGHQPMSYLGRYWIVFNGEIYNYQEERVEMESNGYKFVSKSDTEVIMALYDKYGVKCLKHLRGMFSFAIYDEKENTLFCARDRIGKKPFKYYIDDNVFLFASELKAILTQPEYIKEPDYTAIHHYLTYQYVPSPLTGFKGIKKLEAAHYLFIDMKTGSFTKKRYWDIDYTHKLDLDENSWKKLIFDKLEESVRLRMISDVPIGAFLSGGIDSSAVVGVMSQLSDRPIKTFTIGFDDKKYDETKYANIVAKKFKTDHTEFKVKAETVDVLPLLVKHFEEPFADSSALPTYYVSKLTRDKVTVALNGDGGDENFGGYERYSLQKFSLFYDHFSLLNKVAIPVTKLLKDRYKNTLFDRANKFAVTMKEDYRERYLNYICYFNDDAKMEMYTDGMRARVENSNSKVFIVNRFNKMLMADKMDQTLYADFGTYLPDDLMVKVDIASMIVALEGRSPFLDHEFMELTAKIPFDLKLKGMNNKKYILKEALRGLVPDEVMFRPKMGFGVPIDNWFKGSLYKYVESILLSERAVSRGLFNKEYTKRLLKSHRDTNINQSYRLWALLMLELWFREYFD